MSDDSEVWSPEDIWPGGDDGGEGKAKVGRPSKFREDFILTAKKLCEMGATAEELAFFLEVSITSIERWQLAYPEFRRAIQVGRVAANDRVKGMLYRRCLGYRYTEQQIVKLRNGADEDTYEVVEVEKELSPDVSAMRFWLTNRDRENWTERSVVEQVTDLGARLDKARARRRSLSSPGASSAKKRPSRARKGKAQGDG